MFNLKDFFIVPYYTIQNSVNFYYKINDFWKFFYFSFFRLIRVRVFIGFKNNYSSNSNIHGKVRKVDLNRPVDFYISQTISSFFFQLFRYIPRYCSKMFGPRVDRINFSFFEVCVTKFFNFFNFFWFFLDKEIFSKYLFSLGFVGMQFPFYRFLITDIFNFFGSDFFDDFWISFFDWPVFFCVDFKIGFFPYKNFVSNYFNNKKIIVNFNGIVEDNYYNEYYKISNFIFNFFGF